MINQVVDESVTASAALINLLKKKCEKVRISSARRR